MPPASLCFTDVTFFLMWPLSFGIGLTDRNGDCCVNTVDEKYHGYKFGEVWSSIPLRSCGAFARVVNPRIYAKIRRALVFKAHSLGGSSIASL